VPLDCCAITPLTLDVSECIFITVEWVVLTRQTNNPWTELVSELFLRKT